MSLVYVLSLQTKRTRMERYFLLYSLPHSLLVILTRRVRLCGHGV